MCGIQPIILALQRLVLKRSGRTKCVVVDPICIKLLCVQATSVTFQRKCSRENSGVPSFLKKCKLQRTGRLIIIESL